MQSADIEPPLDAEQEYRAIEAALLETTRGRWFLAEHSRRSRRLETVQLESAIDQLKSSMREPPALLGRLETDLCALEDLVRATRTELFARPSAEAGGEPSASTGLLKAAEDLHELVWTLQAKSLDADVCERIGRQAAAIFALTARQAQESQRVQKFAAALDAVAARIAGVLETVLHEMDGDPIRDAPPLPEFIAKSG